MKPRPYQNDAVDSFFSYYMEGNTGNPVIAMPTGTGKSIVLASLFERIIRTWPRQRIMMLTHVKELIEQNYSKMLKIWPTAPVGIYSSGLRRRDYGAPVTFAGIASVAKRPELFGWIDLIFIDECHLVSDKANTQYRKFIAALMKVNPNLKVAGLTATPFRLGQGLITDGGLFTDFCFDNTSMERFNELIRQGYLSTLIPRKTTQQIDLSDVGIRAGDFIAGQLITAVDKDMITYAALLEAKALAYERRCWLVFAVSVEHAEKCADCLNAIGISATCVHSKMGSKVRDKNLEDFKNGKYRAIVNNNVLTTGFDHPEIDCIVMLRPTASPGLWVQMLGRGTRPVYVGSYDLDQQEGRLSAIAAGPKQNCLVLDFAGNTERLGPINDPVLPKKRGAGGGAAPVKECPQCHMLCHTSVRICESCGYEFPERAKFGPGSSTHELIKEQAPVVEVQPVTSMTVQLHEKAGKPPAIRVSYYCGIQRFSEFVCLEHGGYAAKRGRDWWRAHVKGAINLKGEIETPETTNEALKLIEHLNVPTHIRVWINKRYPEIMEHDFTGTAFGKEKADETKTPLRARVGAKTGRSSEAPEMLSAVRPYDPAWEDF